MLKICSKCKIEKDISEFYKNKQKKDGFGYYCKKCHLENNKKFRNAHKSLFVGYSRQWQIDNPDKWKNSQLKSIFGISLSKFNEILKTQNNVCKLCKKPFDSENKNLVIDHDHRCCKGKRSCGKCIRGLIHRKCNIGLGMFNDDIEFIKMALNYLETNHVSN